MPISFSLKQFISKVLEKVKLDRLLFPLKQLIKHYLKHQNLTYSNDFRYLWVTKKTLVVQAPDNSSDYIELDKLFKNFTQLHKDSIAVNFVYDPKLISGKVGYVYW